MDYEIFEEEPDDFISYVEVAGCYCFCDDKLLLLKRHSKKPYGKTWGLPAGKVDQGESPEMGVVREVFEETGIRIDVSELQDIGKFYLRLPHMDYIFHRFFKQFTEFPTVTLELTEHIEYRWVTIDEAMNLPLILGGKEALSFFNQWLKK